MKNYIFFDGTLLEGGAERVISILTNKMSEDNDVSINIILWYDEEPFYNIGDKVNVIRIPQVTGSNNFGVNFLWLRKYLLSNKGALISFLAPFNILAIVAHFFIRTPIIVADRSDPYKSPANFWIKKLRDFLYLFADLIVLQTEHNSQYFSYISHKKRKIIYNPVSLKEKNGLALRTVKKKKIVSVGRLIPLKNQEMLIKAFNQIYDNEYELWIYGEGNYREKLEKLISDLGLKERVHLPGNSKNVHNEICDAKFFVLTSNYEGMSNALLEAMCLGLPVISTKVSGAIDVIKDGVNGFLVEQNDITGLVNRMNILIDDESKCSEFSFEASKIAKITNLETIVNQWKESIDECYKV